MKACRNCRHAEGSFDPYYGKVYDCTAGERRKQVGPYNSCDKFESHLTFWRALALLLFGPVFSSRDIEQIDEEYIEG